MDSFRWIIVRRGQKDNSAFIRLVTHVLTENTCRYPVKEAQCVAGADAGTSAVRRTDL